MSGLSKLTSPNAQQLHTGLTTVMQFLSGVCRSIKAAASIEAKLYLHAADDGSRVWSDQL